jgi:hypothetical protein
VIEHARVGWAFPLQEIVFGEQAKQYEIIKKMAGQMVFHNMVNETAIPSWRNAELCTVVLKLWSTDKQRRSRTFFPKKPPRRRLRNNTASPQE